MNQTISSEENSAPFVVNVKLLSDEIFKFEVDKNIRVAEFKALISPIVKVPIESMRIIFAGKLLLDDKPICEYVQESGLIIHLIARSTPQIEEPIQPNMIHVNNSQEHEDDAFHYDVISIMENLFGATSFVNQHNNTSMIEISIGTIPISTVSSAFEVFEPQYMHPTHQRQPIHQTQPTEPTQPTQPIQPIQPTQPRQPREPENEQLPRISYSEINQLDRNLNHLIIPREREITSEENLTAEGVIRYLRRLHHQSSRALNELSTSLDNPTEGTSESLESFIPILQSLNSSNAVAINCLNELRSRRQNNRRTSRNNRHESNHNINAQNLPFANSQIINRERLGMVNRNGTNHLSYEQNDRRSQNEESTSNIAHESVFARILQNRLINRSNNNSQSQSQDPEIPSMENNMFAQSNTHIPRQDIQPSGNQERYQQIEETLILPRPNVEGQVPLNYSSVGRSEGLGTSRESGEEDEVGEITFNPEVLNELIERKNESRKKK